eukprot:GCRY01001712.1.p1 GENE.GCRY01001712.1~~GCRY01001712.1.p1  ORF type:complete len:351 (+),score=-7.49 GCRY01001712.1:121-1173(+)
MNFYHYKDKPSVFFHASQILRNQPLFIGLLSLMLLSSFVLIFSERNSGVTFHPIVRVDWIPSHGRVLEGYRLFFAVYTAPQYIERRNSLRQAYQQQMNLNEGCGYAFVIGDYSLMKNETLKGLLLNEMALYDDFIVLPVEEHYDLLSHKTNALIQTVAQKLTANLFPYDFLFKADDDSFVQIASLRQLLQHNHIPPYEAVFGHSWKNFLCGGIRNVVESSYLPKDAFPECETGWHFFSGSGYGLSLDVVQNWASNINWTLCDIIPYEDVNMGYNILSVPHTNYELNPYYCVYPSKCHYQCPIVRHYTSPEEMVFLRRIVDAGHMCLPRTIDPATLTYALEVQRRGTDPGA